MPKPTYFGYAILLASILMKIGVFSEDIQEPFAEDDPDLPTVYELGRDFKNKIGWEVDPCVDFYDYACGKAASNLTEPEETNSVFQERYRKVVIDKLQRIIKTTIDPDEQDLFKQVKSFYQACINTTHIEELGEKPFLDVLAKVGQFPVLSENWDEGNFSWIETTFKFREHGLDVNSLIHLRLTNDPDDNSKEQLHLFQPIFPYPLSFQEKSFFANGGQKEILDGYVYFLIDLVLFLGASNKTVVQDMRDVVDFQKQLADIFVAMIDDGNSTIDTNQMSLKQVQQMYGWLDWKHYINTILTPKIQINDDEMLSVNGKYYNKLGDLLAATPNRTLANYLYSQVMMDAVDLLDERFRSRMDQLVKSVLGSRDSAPREFVCAQMTLRHHPISSAFLVQEHGDFTTFDFFLRPGATKMVKFAQESLVEILNDSLLDEVSKMKVVKMVEQMRFEIGFPEELNNNTLMAEVYDGLKMIPGEFYGSYLELAKYDVDSIYQQLRRPSSDQDWQMFSATSADIFYQENQNLMKIPLPVLQDQFFHFFGYGTNLIKIVKVMLEAVESAAKNVINLNCFQNQHETHLNQTGTTTMHTLAYETESVRIARSAYQKYSESHSTKERLPYFDTAWAERLFWINWAQTRCSNAFNDQLRILLPLRNNEQFSQDFNCNVVTPLNPAKRCTIW